MSLLLKAKLLVATPIFLLGGCDKSGGLDVCGLPRFRRAIGDALALLVARAPDEARRVRECVSIINQSVVSVYTFRSNPSGVFIRFRKDFGPIDWAGTLVHAAVHGSQYRELRRSCGHDDAVRELMRNSQHEREAVELERQVLKALGVSDADSYFASRGVHLHVYFAKSRARKARSNDYGANVV